MADGLSIDTNDANMRRQANAAMGTQIQLLDDVIFHINHGAAMLTGKQHDRGLNFLTCLLLNRAFNSLWRAREDAVCGYYAESLTLCRSAFEHWATARWVELHPHACGHWLWAVFEEVQRPTKYPPTVSQMLGELGKLGERAAGIYDVLSKFVHPRSIGLRWLIDFDSDTTYFHTGGHYDETGLKVCLYFLIAIAHDCLEPLARLQHRMLGSVDAGWLRRGKELSNQADGFMAKMEQDVAQHAVEADRLTNGS
jgi:hypothetical protein